VAVLWLFRGLKPPGAEGFGGGPFTVKTGSDVYDDFYASMYDTLVANPHKTEYEVNEMVNASPVPGAQTRWADIGCGTGDHVAVLASKGVDAVGVDLSPAMVRKARAKYPDCTFLEGDVMRADLFPAQSLTHISCMYFTLYYLPDKARFFENCMRWLLPGGTLFVHLVDRTRFDPILPPGNPLVFVSPQRYADKRITSTKLKFQDFAYSADFRLDEARDRAVFAEKIRHDRDGRVRKHEQVMYMEPTDAVLAEAQQQGFVLGAKIDLLPCQYEYQYVYMLTKPSQ
jgi:ubiquinone/menaquinone biosynthesis C-methylase UbiE